METCVRPDQIPGRTTVQPRRQIPRSGGKNLVLRLLAPEMDSWCVDSEVNFEEKSGTYFGTVSATDFWVKTPVRSPVKVPRWLLSC